MEMGIGAVPNGGMGFIERQAPQALGIGGQAFDQKFVKDMSREGRTSIGEGVERFTNAFDAFIKGDPNNQAQMMQYTVAMQMAMAFTGMSQGNTYGSANFGGGIGQSNYQYGGMPQTQNPYAQTQTSQTKPENQQNNFGDLFKQSGFGSQFHQVGNVTTEA